MTPLRKAPAVARLCQNSVLVGHDHKMQRMRFQPYAICGHDSEFRNSLAVAGAFFFLFRSVSSPPGPPGKGHVASSTDYSGLDSGQSAKK